MSKLLFANPSSGGESAKPSDWDPVFTNEGDGKSPNLSPINPNKSDAIIVKTRRRRPTRTPEGLHRDTNTETNYGGDPKEVVVGQGDKSESTHEYYYAPGGDGLAGRLLFTKKVKAEPSLDYHENPANIEPPRVEDSNQTPSRPGRRGDKNVRLDRLPGDKSYPSGSPEPADAADVGAGNMVYPLDGRLLTARETGVRFIVSPDGSFKSWKTDTSSDPWDEEGLTSHTVKLQELFDFEPSVEAVGDEILQEAISKGYTRGGLVDGTLFIEPGAGRGVEWVLSKLPSELLIAKELVAEGHGQVKTDEGEDVSEAWRHRNSPRKRVLSKLLFKADTKQVEVADAQADIKFKYEWDSEVNRLPSSVMVMPTAISDGEALPSFTFEMTHVGWEPPKGLGNTQQNLVDLAFKNMPELLKNIGARVSKKFKNQETQEKDDGKKPKSYNVLEDPALALAPGITQEEKVFTTIPSDAWDGDMFVVDTAKLDPATLNIIKQHPKSSKKQHKYFSWEYLTKDQAEQAAAKSEEELGFNVGPAEDSLIVNRLPAWKKIQSQVESARTEEKEHHED